MKFSANLGFLWSLMALPDAIREAKAAGFDAVECHWPYETPAGEVKNALDETGLPMLGLNTVRGRPGENGLSALPGRESEARAAIDQAIEYASTTGTRAIHVMAGFAEGPEAHATFVENLKYARQAAPSDIMLLIEPLNRHDAPNYFLKTTQQAADILAELDQTGVKLMFDCYHVGRTEGDIVTRFRALRPIIGHIQFASVPDRGAPDQGEVNYGFVLSEIVRSGWTRPLGAEYKPKAATSDSLGWLKTYRGIH
ncbi:TIM barrel protein [Marivita sp. XM-24bin2]|jgi:hydroxypyruvate isomerase|uniref:hydroxypyruvate isomerase family protein n=1 Tax=unclassified Marivita TaxID=2632480 RepID=UPI000D7A932C|nr:TIM barrel protein [Marivita sp. XM-24bin2]MCR9109057.1 TIM barrel protein [Paracoccaceae bacterium]PWL36955.1 MAG: isomerase [Marivita sp. XM-24bin2]